MSNCSNHKKELFGQTDMKHLAQDIGDLHYESLSLLLYHLSDKIYYDGRADFNAGRTQLAEHLFEAQQALHRAHQKIEQAYKVCEPHMKNPNPAS